MKSASSRATPLPFRLPSDSLPRGLIYKGIFFTETPPLRALRWSLLWPTSPFLSLVGWCQDPGLELRAGRRPSSPALCVERLWRDAHSLAL